MAPTLLLELFQGFPRYPKTTMRGWHPPVRCGVCGACGPSQNFDRIRQAGYHPNTATEAWNVRYTPRTRRPRSTALIVEQIAKMKGRGE